MMYVGHSLHTRCLVSVGDDNRKETRALVKIFFPHGFRQGLWILERLAGPIMECLSLSGTTGVPARLGGDGC